MIGQDQDPFAGWASSAKSYEGMTPTEVRLYRNRRLLESAYTEDDKERLERDIKRDTPRGFWESLFTDEYGQETTLPFAVPFIGSASSGIDLYNAHLASEKGRATKEQSRILKDYYDYAVRPTTTWGQAASIGREVMAFGVEFAASGGAGAIGAKAIAAGGKTASKSMLRKVLVSGFREKSINAGKTGLAKMGLALKEAALRTPGQLTRMELQKEGVRIAGALVGIEAEGGPIRARAYMNYLHHRYQIVPENEYGASVRVIDDSYGMWSAAIPNAVVDNLVEVFSEHTGYAIAHMVPSLKMGLLGKPFKEGGVSEKVMAALGLAGDVPSAQLLQRVGVSGLIPEMGEEFVGALVRDIVHEIAPVLADEGNTQHLIDNIVPITLGMGLGIFGTSAATGAISYTDGLGMYGKFSPIAKKLFSEMNSAVPFGERVGVLRGLERIARLNAEGLSANGSAELVAGANVRAKFFISDAVTEQAKSNLHRKSIEKGEEKPDLSREAIKEEKELLWAEFIEKPLAGNVQKVVEATGEILEEAGSPAMEHLIRLGVIEEGEVAELLGNAEKRLLELQAAAKDGTLTEYWEALGAELIEVELAKTVEAGVAVSADPTSLRVAAFTAAKKELARLMAIAETGKSGGELLEREIQRLEFEPHLEGESKDIASRVSRADKNWAREHVEEVKEALERASATYRKGQEKAGKDVSEEGQLFGVAEEQDSDNETVTAAINFGVILIAIDGRGTGVAGLWDSKEKILFYDPQEIEAQALAHNIGAAEMYRITIYRELLRAHITDIGKENASAWLQAAKKWLDEVNANWRVKLKINTAQYEGLSDEKILEHEVTLALSMFAEVGKVQELREEEEATGFVAAIKRFASWLMEIALPKTFGSSKILVSLRDALNVAGFDVSEMTPAQVMMAGATAEHVRQIIGMLSPSMEIASVIANDFIGPLQEHQKRLAEITKEEAPGEAAPPRQEAAPGPEEPQINRKYLESLPSRKAVIDLAKDLKVEGLNVTNVSGSKDQVINSILKALEAEIVHDFYADPIDDVGFMALEGTGPLQQRMTKKIGNQINERAKRHLPKERVKTRQATQFIGRGKAGSSTSKYMQMYNEEGVANTGDYTANDIVYVSSNGKRVGRVNPVIRGELQGVYTNIDKAIKAGASIIMDTAEHLQKTGGYNIGELALADYLATHGYARQGVSGMWKPADKGAAPKGPTPVTTSAQSASQPVFTRGETIGGSPHEEMTEAATSSELEALRAEAGIIQADGSIPEKTPREKQAALWKSDKYTKAPHYMLTPYNAAKVGKIVLVHDYLSADSATYRGRIINIDKTGMVEIRVRRLRVDNGAIKVSEEAPYTMSTSRHNLYSPNFSWHLVSTEEGLAWRSMGKIKGKVQTVQVKVSGEFEESGLSAIPKVSRPPISFQALQLYKRKEGGAITTEDVERTGRRVYEHMRTLVNLESLAFIGKKREAVKEEKEEEKEKSTGITYKADSSANRYQFNQALADLIDADPTIVERIIKFDSKGFHIKKKTIRAALMATKNVEGLIVSAKDIMIAEAAIGGGWEYLIKPIKEDLSRLKSGVITENGLRVLIKQASKKSPGSPREVALKFLLSSLLRAEGLKSASVGGVFDVKSVPPGQAERKVVPDEEDKRIKVEETSTTETDPSQSAAPLGKGINIRQLESILGYMFTASVQAATPMGAAESAEYEKALKDAGIGFRYDESGAIDSTDAWWNAWVSTVPGDNLTPEEYAAIADIQAHSAPMESTEGDTTEELTLDYQTPSRRSLGATLTVLTSDVATGVKGQRMPTIATARDEDIKAMIAELLPKNNEETFPNLARIILSGHVSEAREELIRVLGGATGGRWKKSDVPVKDVFGIEQDPRAVFEPLSINLKGLSLKGKKILKAFDRVAAEQSRYEMGWREKIRGESAEGVAKTVRNIAGTRVSGTAGWIHLLNKEEDLSMLRGTLKHVSTLAGLEGASALVEYRVSSLDNLVSKARDSDVVSKRIMDLAPAALTEGIRNKYTILSSEINTAIQLLEDGDYAGLAIHLEVEHKSNPEVYLMAPKRQSLEMPMIKRFADAHSTLIKRAVMAGKWVVQTGVPGGKVQLVLNPSIMLTKDIGGPNLIKRLEALRELRPDWKGSGRERRAALLPNATSADIEKFIQDGLSLTRTKGGLVGGRKLPLGPIKVSSRNVDLPSKDKPGRRPKRKWGTAPTTHPTEQTWPTKEAPMRQPAEGELPTWGTTLTLSRGGVEINVLFRGTGTSSGDTITVFPYNPKGEGTAWFKEMGYGQRALLHTFARSIPAYWHLDGNRLAEADRAVVSKAFEMEDAYINEETDFLALDPTTAGIRKNFASMGGSLLSMWDASKLPLINGSAEMSTVFLMSYDRWREDSAEWVYRLDADLKKNREDIIDYVENVEGLKGLSNIRAKNARIDQIRAALFVRMDLDYWAVSKGGRATQLYRKGWKAPLDEQGLWDYFAREGKLTKQHRDLFNLAMEFRSNPGKWASINTVFNRMDQSQKIMSEMALKAKLIDRKVDYHMHLDWDHPDASKEDIFESIGYRMDVGAAATPKRFVSVLEGWSRGLKLKSIDGVMAIKKNGLAVVESTHNKALAYTLELSGIIKKVGRKPTPGYVELEDRTFKGYEAEKWVAKFLNNAMSRLRVIDIENSVFRKYMHMTIAMKHNLLMLGFFHHHAFPRSYFFTVDSKTAWKDFLKLGHIAKASLMSYMYAAGGGTRKSLDKTADRFNGYSMGRDAILSRAPMLIELIRAGLKVQVGEDVRATSSGGGYDMDEVAVMDERLRSGAEWLIKQGAPRVFANKVIGMLQGVRDFQRQTATWLFNDLGSNLKAAQAILHMEELVEKHKERLKVDYDGSFRKGLAGQVADLSNGDFGGINELARGGRLDTLAGTGIAMPRHARSLMWARALLLAPDWTESNLMTVLRSVWKDGKMAEEDEMLEIGRKMHQHMWVRVVSRGLFLQILINAIMAGLDDDRDFLDIYKQAGFPGYSDDLTPKWQKLRWMEANLSGLSPNESRKFISVLGHFADPFHWVADMFGERGGIMTPLMKKGSPGLKTVLSFIDGVDWAGRRFSTWDEFWGTDDDAGIYQRKTKQPDGTYKYPGQSKAGRYKWQISRYGVDKGSVGIDQMFTYTFEQLRRFMPIQTRTIMDTAMGSKDGFDLMGDLLGFKASRTWPD